MVGGPTETTPSDRVDRACTLLASARRRVVLYALRDGESATVDELVDEILADEECSAPTERDRERVYVSLHHKHLPKLDDAGVVEYDADEGVVLAADADWLEPLLGAVHGHETGAEADDPALGTSDYGLT